MLLTHLLERLKANVSWFYKIKSGCALDLTYTFQLQEVLLWIKSVVEQYGEKISKEQLTEHVWKTLNSGKVKVLHPVTVLLGLGFLCPT